MKDAACIDSWSDYRRRVRRLIGVWLGGFAIAACLASALSYTPARDWAPLAVGILWMAMFVVAAMRVQVFRCPQCRHAFFKATWYYWPFARRCVHCGLPKWQ